MKSIGSLLFIFGAAAVLFGFMDRVPTLLSWIYQWGDTPAWIIKIGLIIAGAALYVVGARKKAETQSAE